MDTECSEVLREEMNQFVSSYFTVSLVEVGAGPVRGNERDGNLCRILYISFKHCLKFISNARK